jgi:NDP-sugar pyrophosphorylase family protein
VILAGGKGSRLAPYTTVIPKPLLPLDDRPILDVVVEQLVGCGFDRLTLAVGHLSHLIRAVMGDGSRFGIEIDYHEEEEPLGTVGPLASIQALDDSFLVMNGDILTNLDYAAFLELHRESGNAMTIASHQRVVETDYGVLHIEPGNGSTDALVGFEEKPQHRYSVSMGIYAMEPGVRSFIETGTRLDLPDLVLRLIGSGEQVGVHRFDGYWLDIGRHDDYARALEDFEEMKTELLS